MTTTEEVRMTIKTLAGRQVPNREIARQLDMTEGNVRYHLRRMATGAVDGRTRQRHRAADLAEASRCGVPAGRTNRSTWPTCTPGWSPSTTIRAACARCSATTAPAIRRRRKRARRRVETPPGAQAQVDWASSRDGRRRAPDYAATAFHMACRTAGSR